MKTATASAAKGAGTSALLGPDMAAIIGSSSPTSSAMSSATPGEAAIENPHRRRGRRAAKGASEIERPRLVRDGERIEERVANLPANGDPATCAQDRRAVSHSQLSISRDLERIAFASLEGTQIRDLATSRVDTLRFSKASALAFGLEKSELFIGGLDKTLRRCRLSEPPEGAASRPANRA